MGLFTSRTSSGLEVCATGLKSAEVRRRDGALTLAGLDSANLAGGILVESFTEPNIKDMPSFVGALKSFVRKGGGIRKSLNVALPDNVARSVILEFDSLPAKQEDTESMIRWRFKKLVPFNIEKAALQHQYLGGFRDEGTQKHRFLASVIKSEVLTQYESAFGAAGIKPDRIVISSFAVWNLYHDFLVKESGVARNFALMNVSGRKMAVMVFERGVIRFIRLKDLGAFGNGGDSGAGLPAEALPRELHASLTYYKENFSGVPVGLLFIAGDMDGVDRVASELSEKAALDVRVLNLTDAVEAGGLALGVSHSMKYSAACGAAAGW